MITVFKSFKEVIVTFVLGNLEACFQITFQGVDAAGDFGFEGTSEPSTGGQYQCERVLEITVC